MSAHIFVFFLSVFLFVRFVVSRHPSPLHESQWRAVRPLCVYVGQQSSTRLAALEECCPEVPAHPPNLPRTPYSLPDPPYSFIVLIYCFPYSSLSFCFFFHHFLSTPLFPLIIPPSTPSPPSFCHPSLPFSFLPFGHSLPWSSTPSFPPQPFF